MSKIYRLNLLVDPNSDLGLKGRFLADTNPANPNLVQRSRVWLSATSASGPWQFEAADTGEFPMSVGDQIQISIGIINPPNPFLGIATNLLIARDRELDQSNSTASPFLMVPGQDPNGPRRTIFSNGANGIPAGRQEQGITFFDLLLGLIDAHRTDIGTQPPTFRFIIGAALYTSNRNAPDSEYGHDPEMQVDL